MGDEHFSDDDFGDSDHLLPQGGDKLTKDIYKRMETDLERDGAVTVDARYGNAYLGDNS
jgi:hypothetical protein